MSLSSELEVSVLVTLPLAAWSRDIPWEHRVARGFNAPLTRMMNPYGHMRYLLGHQRHPMFLLALVGTPPVCPGQLIRPENQNLRLISLLSPISRGYYSIRHLGTRWAGDGRPSAELEADLRQKLNLTHGFFSLAIGERGGIIGQSEISDRPISWEREKSS